MANELYPVFLKVNALEVLIVGGGMVGLEKTENMLRTSPNARITLVAQHIVEEIKALAEVHPSVTLHERSFFNEDLTGMQVVIVATDNAETNQQIWSEAKNRGLLVNVADTPDLCDFYMASIVSKGDLKIAISTNGKSPTLAKRLKEMLNDVLPEEIDPLLQKLRLIRDNLKGDFEFKVKTLNALTSDWVNRKISNKPNKE